MAGPFPAAPGIAQSPEPDHDCPFCPRLVAFREEWRAKEPAWHNAPVPNFGSLDARVRQELRRWLRRLHDDIKLTSVFVTHDQEEALEVADRVAVMNRGRIEQLGPPQEIVDRPASPFVLEFIGNVNVFRGRVQSGRAELGALSVAWPEHPHDTARPATGYARPYELDVERTAEAGGGVWAQLDHAASLGATVRLELRDADGALLEVELSRERWETLAATRGERFYVRPRRLRVFVEDEAVPTPS